MAAPPVEIKLTDGPYTILANDGRGIDAEYELQGGTIAREFFPPVSPSSSANYVLTLRKQVPSEHEIAQVETELNRTLQSLAEAWPFSGGNRLQLSRKITREKPNVDSNADRVRDQFAAERGARTKSATLRVSACCSGTWDRFPLARAIQVCELAKRQKVLADVLGYYYRTSPEESKWCMELYKVRDVLAKHLDGGKACRCELSIAKREWSDFGKDTNVERHDSDKTLTNQREGELREIGRQWILKYIAYLEK